MTKFHNKKLCQKNSAKFLTEFDELHFREKFPFVILFDICRNQLSSFKSLELLLHKDPYFSTFSDNMAADSLHFIIHCFSLFYRKCLSKHKKILGQSKKQSFHTFDPSFRLLPCRTINIRVTRLMLAHQGETIYRRELCSITWIAILKNQRKSRQAMCYFLPISQKYLEGKLSQIYTMFGFCIKNNNFLPSP